MKRVLLVLPILLTTAAVATAGGSAFNGPTTNRLSVKPNGKEVQGAASDFAAISGGGRYVVYESSGQLVGKDKDQAFDVYLYDRKRGENELVSVDSASKPRGDVGCDAPDISPSGRYVSFGCDGALANSDQNGIEDVYRRDLKTQKTIVVSLTAAGAQLSGINDDSEISGVSSNGLVAWESLGEFVSGDSNDSRDIFVRNPEKETTVRASLASSDAELPDGVGGPGPSKISRIAISGDGRHVAFSSLDVATTESDFGFIVDADVFVRDLKRGTTIRASLKSNGSEADPDENADSYNPSISEDGRYVAFVADGFAQLAGNDDNAFHDVYVRDTEKGKTTLVSLKSNGEGAVPTGFGPQYPEISPNGRFVVWDTEFNFGGGKDRDENRDVYRHDTQTGKTVLVSLKANGGRADTNQLADPANRGWVAFSSMGKLAGTPDDGNDFDVFLRGPLSP
ncbi:MAG: hypothetical protein M3355_08855 [Actinomycetota bacterium]|nr:hypothetical protein [Actinomycetota bacterium]